MPVLTRKRKREELRLDVWQNKDLRRCIFSFLPPAEGKCCLRYVESLPPLPYVWRRPARPGRGCIVRSVDGVVRSHNSSTLGSIKRHNAGADS